MAKLGDIATIQSGGTPARSIAEYWEDGTIPWVKISDIKSKHLNQTEEMITEAGLENSSAKIFPKGTILYTIFATLGETSILDINAATNQAIAGISITDSRVLPDYLYYYLLSQKIHVQKIGRGVAQNNINMKLLRDFDVPLPSKEAQLNIIEQLNRVTELLFLRKQQLTKLDELIKARFVEMFGDLVENPKQFPCVLLGSIMTVMPQNGLYKPQSAYVQDKFGTPILRIDGFYNGKVTDFNNLKRLCCTDFEKERYLLVENDIVINRVNSIEYLGKCARISGLQEDTVFESNMMRFHLDDSKVNSTYITTVLCSQYIYRQILTRAKKAVKHRCTRGTNKIK